MTEKEKMLSGERYNAFDNELVNDRNKVKALCREYNLKPSAEGIKKIFAKTGESIIAEPDFWCDYGYNITTGENFYSNHNCVMLDVAKISFGDNVLIGPNCGFYTASHPIDAKERLAGLEFAAPIRIGNNVWIGGNVAVLGGVTIGDNAVIGAGSVVTKDIPSNCVAVGNPARVIKQL